MFALCEARLAKPGPPPRGFSGEKEGEMEGEASGGWRERQAGLAGAFETAQERLVEYFKVRTNFCMFCVLVLFFRVVFLFVCFVSLFLVLFCVYSFVLFVLLCSFVCFCLFSCVLSTSRSETLSVSADVILRYKLS